MALCTENFQTRETVVTRSTWRGVRDEKSPLSRYLVPWITLKFVQEASLFSFQKEGRPVGPSSSRVREGSCTYVSSTVVLDRAKNVRAIRKSHTWMRGDSRCSIYVTCNWPRGAKTRRCHMAQLIALEDVATIISRGRGCWKLFQKNKFR